FLRVQKDDDIKTRLWHKLAINCAINPLTALLGCRNGELLDLPGERRVLRIICEEAAQVMAAEGIIGDAEELYARVCIIIEATADNYSSMLQDLRAGRSTEIDYLNGYLLRQGAAHGIPLPCNTLLLDMIRLRQRMSQPF
ncbi:MAG TPA: 2-dehydropantoate 2-reductase, partial [Candidatus Competibacteraceae bacterium]|nr:2-dehydropantoate 2-reductase [Candidatus Competibacteraceae bacterium]